MYVVQKRTIPLKLNELMKLTPFWYLYLSLFFYGAYLCAYQTFLIDFAESRNISSADAARLWTYWGISTILSRISSGFLISSRMAGIRWFTFAFMGIGFFSWILAFSFHGYPNYIAFIISTISNGWLVGIFQQRASLCLGDVFGVENVSLTIGLFYTAQMPFGAFGQPIFGFFVDQADGNYTGAFQIIAIMQTISGLLMFMFCKHGRVIINAKKLDGAFDVHDPRSVQIYASSGFFSVDHLDKMISRTMMTLGELNPAAA